MTRLLILCAFLSLPLAAACTTVDEPPATSAAAFEYTCVPLCLEGVSCQTICALEPFVPGFQVQPGPSTCDELRPINVCGDGCCDAGETRRSDSYCRADCAPAEILRIEDTGEGRHTIFARDLAIGSASPQGVIATSTCP